MEYVIIAHLNVMRVSKNTFALPPPLPGGIQGANPSSFISVSKEPPGFNTTRKQGWEIRDETVLLKSINIRVMPKRLLMNTVCHFFLDFLYASGNLSLVFIEEAGIYPGITSRYTANHVTVLTSGCRLSFRHGNHIGVASIQIVVPFRHKIACVGVG